jgi:hypothetical protein
MNPMDLLNSASPSVLNAGAKVLGAALSPTPVTSGVTGNQEAKNDNSGWNVNFGSGGITSTATATKDNPVTWIIIGAGLIALAIVVRAWRGK